MVGPPLLTCSRSYRSAGERRRAALRKKISLLPAIVLVSLLTPVGVGLAKRPPVSSKNGTVKYPVPGSEDAVGVVSTEAERRVLDDFYNSKVLTLEYQAATNNDAGIFASLMDDRIVNNDERFGRGVILTKSAWVGNFSSGSHHHSTLHHDHVRLVVFGENTVVATGRSTSVLHYGGKLSPGPRLLTEVWVKLNGRWQMIVHAMSDLEDGMEDRAVRERSRTP